MKARQLQIIVTALLFWLIWKDQPGEPFKLMIDPKFVGALRSAGIGTLSILETLEKQSTSKIATGKIQAGKEKLKTLIAQLDDPQMTDDQFQETADKLKEIGQDLINYEV